VTSSPIAPVIPSSSGRPAGAHQARRPVRQLPLAAPAPVPERVSGVVYGLGRVDASGRVADRAVVTALGWQVGDRLTVTAEAGVVVARRDPGGMVVVPARPCVVIPAALRRRCGLRPSDRVLLAAVPAGDLLAAYPLAVLDQAIRAHGHVVPGQAAAL
jgi:bifunctional DNA-binding transcriptional regulator/antitoxin component of YhaV-PrlF toxin-antitoxin module